MPDSVKEKGISLIRINNEKELRRYNVDALAREIHGCAAQRRYPIYLVFYQGKPRGYLHAVPQLVVYPALHPELSTPREFIRIIRSLATEMKRMAGDPLFLLCQKAEELGEKHMRLMRLRRAQEVAYVYTEEGE
jgi:hypothetical protein